MLYIWFNTIVYVSMSVCFLLPFFHNAFKLIVRNRNRRSCLHAKYMCITCKVRKKRRRVHWQGEWDKDNHRKGIHKWQLANTKIWITNQRYKVNRTHNIMINICICINRFDLYFSLHIYQTNECPSMVWHIIESDYACATQSRVTYLVSMWLCVKSFIHIENEYIDRFILYIIHMYFSFLVYAPHNTYHIEIFDIKLLV